MTWSTCWSSLSHEFQLHPLVLKTPPSSDIYANILKTIANFVKYLNESCVPLRKNTHSSNTFEKLLSFSRYFRS